MGANVESKIVVNIQALVQGNRDVKELSQNTIGLEQSVGKTAASMSRLSLTGDRLDGKFGKLKVSSQGFAFSIDGLGKKIAGEFAPLEAAGRKIDEFVRKEKAAIAELERVKAQRASVAAREDFFVQGRDPFAQGVKQHGETPLNKAGGDIAAASLTNNAQADIAAMEGRRAALRKLNDEAVRSGNEGTANINSILNKVRALDETRRFEGLIGGLRGVATGSVAAAAGSRVLQAVMSPLVGIGRVVANVFSQVAQQLQFMAAAFAILVASSPALIFGLLVKEGLAFNSVMEQQGIGLAALIQLTNDLFSKDQPNKPLTGIEAYNAATIIAKASTDRLSVKLIPLAATIEELLPIFNQVVTAGAAAGLTLQDTENVFTDLSAAAQTVHIPLEKLGTGIRLLLNGTARATTVLATSLFGNAKAANEWVKEHKKLGDLAQALHAKLEPFRLALLTSETSFATLGANTRDVFQRLSAIATSGLFERIKKGLITILQSFYDLKTLAIKPEFESLFNFISSALGKAGDYLLTLLTKVIEYVLAIAKYVQDNSSYVSAILGDLVNIGAELGGIVGDVASIAGDADKSRDATASWHVVLGFAAITLGVIRDLFNIILGTVQSLAGALIDTCLAPLEAILSVLGLISGTARDAAAAVNSVRNFGFNFAKAGQARTIGGLAQESGLAATDRFLNGNPNITGNKPAANNASNNFLNRLKHSAAGAEDKSAAAAADRLAHRLAELERRRTDLIEDLKNSWLDISRAGVDSEFATTKDATARSQQELERTLKQRLSSVHDYYAEKNQIDQSAIAQEKQHLLDQFEFEKTEFENKRKALVAKTQIAVNDPKNKGAGIGAALIDNANIEIQQHRNELKVKEVELNKQLLLLDGQSAQTQTDNNQAEQDALDAFETKAREVATAITAITDPLGAEIRKIAEAHADQIREALAADTADQPALLGVIEQIRLLGSVTSSELLKILADAGVKFDDLDSRTKNLVLKMKQLEGQATFKELGTDVSLEQGKLGLSKDKIQDRVNLGVISEAKGRREIAAAEMAARVEIEKAIAAMEQITGLTDEQKLSIAGLKQETSNLGREFDTVGNTINGIIGDDIGNLFNSLLTGVDNIGQACQAFFSGLLIDISKAIFQAIVLKTILSALGLGGIGTKGAGSASGVGGILSGVLGKFADGGEAVGPGTGTSDSILARISNGEWIIPASSAAQAGRSVMQSLVSGTFGRLPRFAAGREGAMGPSGNDAVSGFNGVRINNILDPDLLNSYMTSSAGERTIMNVISRSPNKFKRLLGV